MHGGWLIALFQGILRRSLVDLLRFVHSPTWPVDADNDGVMDHPIHDAGGNDGIAQVVSELCEVV